MHATNVGRSRLPLMFASVAMLAALCGCGSAEQRRLAHEAKQLRAQVPGLLHSDQRQALLYAVAAQRIDPTVEGKWLLTSADQDFEGVQRVLEPVDPATLTAIRTATTVIGSDRSGLVRIWDAKSGRLLASRHVGSAIVKFAASQSYDLLASLNAAGKLELWDLNEPRSPLQSMLGRVPDSRRDPVVAIAFAWQDTRLLALTQSGLVYLYDVTAHRRVGVLDLRHASGSLPWSSAGGALRVTAGQVREEPLTNSSYLLMATAQKAVAKIDLGTLRGATLVPQEQFVGTASAVAGGAPGEPVTLCTSRGVALWQEKTHSIEQEWGAPCTGMALEADTLTAASIEGVDAVRMGPEGAEESLDHYAGRPARALTVGPGGPLEIGEDGSISLLEQEETGVNLRINEAETSSIAQFGAEGDLLETYGFSGAEGLMTVPPQAPGTIEGSPLPNRVIRRYLPSRLWWPQGTSARWLIDSAELGSEYVVAGGEDPTGAASVLVWDAKTGRPLRRLTTAQSGPPSSATMEGEIRPAARQVALLPGRHLLAAYSAQQELIVIWSTESWQPVGAVHVGPIAGFSVSPDESQLLAVSLSDEQSYIQAGNRVTRLLFINPESAQIERQVQSPNTELAGYIPEEGAGIVAIQSGGQMRILDGEGHPTRTLSSKLEAGSPKSLAWKPHSQVMAVAVHGGGVQLVDLASGRVSQPLRSPAQAEAVNLSFSPNGALLAAGNSDIYPPESLQPAVPSVWTIDDGDLEQRACRISGGAPSAAQWHAWTGGLRYVRACRATGGQGGASQSGREPIAEPRIALQHAEEIEAISASGARAKIASADPDSAPTKFVWSKGGTLAWLDGDILQLLEESGKSQQVVCACASVAFAGDGPVAVLDGGQSLVDFGRSPARPREVHTAGLPPYGLTIVGVARQGVVVAGSRGYGGATGPSPSSLFLVGRSGRARRLASLRGVVYEPGALSPSGSALAMSEVESSGTCFSLERLVLLEPQSGQVRFPAMPAGVHGPQVRRLGWSSDGRLTAQIAPTDCNGSDEPLKDEPEARLYEEQDGRLLAREPVGYETQHRAGLRAKVQGRVPDVAEGGTLTVTGERGNLLARIPGVSSFSVMP